MHINELICIFPFKMILEFVQSYGVVVDIPKFILVIKNLKLVYQHHIGTREFYLGGGVAGILIRVICTYN